MRKFLQSLNQRNGPGLSSSTSIPSTGIVTDLNPLRQLLSMRSIPVSVSSSTYTFYWIVYTANLPIYFSEMQDVKRRAAIRLQATKRKETDQGAMGTGSSKPYTKKRLLPKGHRAPKKQKVSSEPVLSLMAEGTKTVTPAKHGGGKGLMIPPSSSKKKPPVLLREDPKYALEKLSSIISNKDYEDLENHSTEAMREMDLFSIAQVRVRHVFAREYIFCLNLTPFHLQAMLMKKGLMERSLHQETALGRVREKAKPAKEELLELRNCKVVSKNLSLSNRPEMNFKS